MSTQVSTEDVTIEENESSSSLPELDEEAPFELRALEAVLRTCTLRLDAACEEVEPVRSWKNSTMLSMLVPTPPKR